MIKKFCNPPYSKQKGGVEMDKKEADIYFGEIYEKTYTELSTYVIARIRIIDDAKDLLQIAYTSFYKRLLNKGAIPAQAAIAYLKTTAKHELGKHFGYIRKRELLSLEDEELPQSVIEEIASDSFEESLLDSLMLEQIWSYIQKKGGLTYRIFILRYTYGLSLEQTAECLSIPMHSVANRIYRTIKELQKQFCGQENLRKEPVAE